MATFLYNTAMRDQLLPRTARHSSFSNTSLSGQ
jgi:hypothetical protein